MKEQMSKLLTELAASKGVSLTTMFAERLLAVAETTLHEEQRQAAMRQLEAIVDTEISGQSTGGGHAEN